MVVFFYGTLTAEDRVASVLDDWRFEGPATLAGFHRVEGRYPTLAPGGSVGGRLLATDAVAALDAYEGVDRGLYVRVTVPVVPASGESSEAAVYVGDPDRLDADVTWPGEGAFPERVRRFVAERDVVVRPGER